MTRIAPDTIERFLGQVVECADTDPVKHMRLAALQRSRPLLGVDLMASWRVRAGPSACRRVNVLS